MGVIRLDKTTRRVLVKEGSETPFTFGNVYKTFGGTDYAAPVSNLTALNGATKASMHVWIKVDAINDNAYFGNFLNTNSDSFGVRIQGKHIYCYASKSSRSVMYYDMTAMFGMWLDIALVYDGTQALNSNRLKLYINNALITPDFMESMPISLGTTVGNEILINKFAESNYIGKAQYSTPVITSDASTPEQIAAFYNGGNGAFPEDCFTNIIANPDTNQLDGATVMTGRLGTPDFQLYNSSTPPPYFVPF